MSHRRPGMKRERERKDGREGRERERKDGREGREKGRKKFIVEEIMMTINTSQ